MRIVSGIHKGKRITAPKKLPVRPTTDFAKEALFNILNNQYHFSALKVIDLFSGTGNIAYEFASRGAQEIIAVDAHFECVKFINKISEEMNMPIRTVKSDAFKFLNATGETAHIIFADPPYNFEVDVLKDLAEITFSRNLLEDGGSLIIEHSKKIDLSHLPHFSEVRKYGNSVFSFFV
ncbi:MAG: RsmD family RNA methyltransferase [Salinimicrobium sediminis]|uniref:16S rRNA (Guanine(966)-N(2))-methyltransferase RsmD n=1 Tax=Salinimicrobium sediminis TaxID=1343891 RepID=A0A285X795_9FLAO|nr:RsmD family RNA methyltransferase [Salinimicrobium sediminis]MDX1602980.1 RsmD family RNA methyltransferase [Salinimicrobium sediminis]MDX1753564.1 RsmD family RNA methyltransferase [Salinimicrobium sediminis]SOC81200.1 16S rRNA (guanine(966)-N(2))-methyltransferase RsmD [Salinimicrobium sediminis]